MNKILLNGDSKIELKLLKEGSIDLLATDPPYGISFMGKDWDKVLPDVDIWKECYRVLKPGSFIAVMSSPRSDVLYRMIKDLEDAGFDMSFSPILWTYHTGFPKASDTSKMIEKRGLDGTKYEGSKLGFQPKPAVEHIIIGMKPHGQKSYIDNVLNFEELPDNVKRTYPFLQTPKPSKKEKDLGMTGEEKERAITNQNKKCLKCDKWELSGTNESCGCDKPDYKHAKSKNNHPTTKPVKLMSYIITLFTREGDWVLDPFMGSGTTGVASKLLDRNFVGIEMTPEYIDIAEQRLSVSRQDLVKYFKGVIKEEQTKLDI
ncbi:MAG: site-specific DNA-methyltransferase [Proteobacteria bacterium]|nr:site-specific DNA-methyltransferase [Pseudomonadota bacterium]